MAYNDLSDPANDIQTVDISSTDFTPLALARGIRSGGAGDIVIVTADGNTRTIPSSLAGEYHPVRVAKVVKSGTTASLMTVYL